VNVSTTASIAVRRSPAAARPGSRKIVLRISRMTPSRSSTAASIRSPTDPVARERAAWRDIPTAKRRWMTVSWRSRAMRSSSEMMLGRSSSDRASPSSITAVVELAKTSAKATSSASKLDDPRTRPRTSAPRAIAPATRGT
jgi:hypothetical protein